MRRRRRPTIVAKRADPRQAGLFDAPLPSWVRPCLPTLVDKPPAGPQWVHEIKSDGYRISAYVAGRSSTIRTRNGLDGRRASPLSRSPLANLKIARFDGERLRYARAVGTGFSEAVASALRDRLDRIRATRCAGHRPRGLRSGRGISGSPRTGRLPRRDRTGELRHASFKVLEK